jgi:hypothetical protein
MGKAMSKAAQGLFGPDAQAMAWSAVTSGDEKALNSASLLRGRKRLRVNAKHPQTGMTLLAAAAEAGNKKIVQALLAKGADPNIAGDSGFTPVTLALKNGHDGVAQILANAGADLDLADYSTGKTALLWAVEMNCTAATIQLLAEKGADLEAKSRAGLTALMIAADQNNADKIRALLRAGANAKAQDLKAGTALSRAREKNHTLVVQLLEQAIAAKGGAVESKVGGGTDAARGPSASKRGNPLAKGALGSQVADVFSTGRAIGLEKDTREKTKDIKYAAVSLDAALNSRK